MARGSPHSCAVCAQSRFNVEKLYRCSGCWDRIYCGEACQKSDWPDHKPICVASNAKWYDRFRKCRDGSLHEGDLELITWDSPKDGTGWANVFKDEEADLKRKFEVKFRGNLEKFHKYWPQGFRWTCCGTDAGMDWGCDHHGTGSRPCTCDFCRMGKPLPDSIYNEQSASRIGLNLPRGPDRRSFNRVAATSAMAGRSLLGLDM